MFVYCRHRKDNVVVELTASEFLQMVKPEYKNFINLSPIDRGIKIPTNEPDVVNHPSHYETGKFECIDVMLEVFGKEKVMAFCQCNAFKYLYRSDRKNGTEDMEKASWYINKYKELVNDN